MRMNRGAPWHRSVALKAEPSLRADRALAEYSQPLTPDALSLQERTQHGLKAAMERRVGEVHVRQHLDRDLGVDGRHDQ